MNALAHLLARLSYGRRWLRSRSLRKASPTLRRLIHRMWLVHWCIRLGVEISTVERQLGNAEEDLTIVKARLD